MANNGLSGSDEAEQPLPDDLEQPLLQSSRERSNLGRSTIILAKTVIGAGIAAIPLTQAILGWPLALLFLLLVAYATHESLIILVGAINSTRRSSYPDVTREVLGFWIALLLELAIVAFGVGLMIVYEVVIGDMLVGNEKFRGLVCSWLGGTACSRPLVVGVVSVVVLLPAVSFRSLESSAVISWIGMGALFVWGAATIILFIAAAARHRVQAIRSTPDKNRLGDSGVLILANICAVIPVLTTAFSCQAAAPFVMAELKPKTPKTMKAVALGALAITTGLYALIAIGSYLIFGKDMQADILQNYTSQRLQAVVPGWLAEALFILVRLSFMLGVITLFPLMMFPARDGLVRILSRRTEPLPTVAFYIVTYGITAFVYAVSVVTPSIWGPIQIIGATAGAVIGFLVPGLLAFKEGRISEPGSEAEGLTSNEQIKSSWNLRRADGWLLVIMAIVQSITGIASQIVSPEHHQ